MRKEQFLAHDCACKQPASIPPWLPWISQDWVMCWRCLGRRIFNPSPTTQEHEIPICPQCKNPGRKCIGCGKGFHDKCTAHKQVRLSTEDHDLNMCAECERIYASTFNLFNKWHGDQRWPKITIDERVKQLQTPHIGYPQQPENPTTAYQKTQEQQILIPQNLKNNLKYHEQFLDANATWRQFKAPPLQTSQFLQTALKQLMTDLTPQQQNSIRVPTFIPIERITEAIQKARTSMPTFHENSTVITAEIRKLLHRVVQAEKTWSLINDFTPPHGHQMPQIPMEFPASHSDIFRVISFIFEQHSLPSPPTNVHQLPHGIDLTNTPSTNGRWTYLIMSPSSWCIISPASKRMHETWIMISQQLGMFDIRPPNNKHKQTTLFQWISNPPTGHKAWVFASTTGSRQDRWGNSLPHMPTTKPPPLPAPSRSTLVKSIQPPVPPPVPRTIQRPAGNYLQDSDNLTNMILHSKGFSDATWNNCLISSIVQLTTRSPRLWSNHIPHAHIRLCQDIRNHGRTQQVPGFQCGQNGHWPTLDLTQETVDFICDYLNVRTVLRIAGWNTSFAHGYPNTHLANIIWFHPTIIQDVDAPIITVHVWTPGYDTHFEPVWTPFASQPEITAKVDAGVEHMHDFIIHQAPIPAAPPAIPTLGNEQPTNNLRPSADTNTHQANHNVTATDSPNSDTEI